jgi:carboxypeptidase PM20D1
MGEGGALAIANLLQSRNVQLDYLLDEGTFIVKGIMPNVQRPIALYVSAVGN